MLVLLALIAAVPLAPLGGKGVDVVIVADLSRSMPADSRGRALEIIRLLEQRRAAGDRVGIVTYGREPRIERLPEELGEASAFVQEVDRDGSDLGRCDRSCRQPDPARAARPADRALGRRGERSAGGGGGARSGGARACRSTSGCSAAARRRTSPSNRSTCPAWSTSASRFSSPRRCAPIARSTPRPSCCVTASRSRAPTRTFQPGATQLTFRDLIDRPGIARYRLELSARSDRVPENNRGDGAVRVEAPATILLVNASGRPDNLSRALSAGKLRVSTVRPSEMPQDPAGLLAFRAVILENVPAGEAGPQALGALARFVDRPRRRTAPDRRPGVVRRGRLFQVRARSVSAGVDGGQERASQAVAGDGGGARSFRQHGRAGRRRSNQDGPGESGDVRGDRDARAVRRGRRHCRRQRAACDQPR